jgi:hypothetical protein
LAFPSFDYERETCWVHYIRYLRFYSQAFNTNRNITYSLINLKNKTFFKDELTWFEAQKCCASRSGQLPTIDDKIVSCNNIPRGAETLWTGNVRRPSKWIEFQGKLNEIDRYIYKYFK